MTAPQFPSGIPPDRLWLTVSGPDDAWAALLALYAYLRERPAQNGGGSGDRV